VVRARRQAEKGEGEADDEVDVEESVCPHLFHCSVQLLSTFVLHAVLMIG